jgi:uncharacterized membrane protein YcaP (DUF421 family)
MAEPMLFDSWTSLLRVIIVGAAAYVALIIMLRASGKRTLSKMNAFDFVVTVALGSTLATVLLSRSVPLADGVLALALLVYLQYAITWLSVRSQWVMDLVKGEPTLLVRDGVFLNKAMKSSRVTQEEILAALRQHGFDDPREASCVVLETDGSLSIVPKSR